MVLHSTMALASMHPIHRWEYADAAARSAASGFTTDDVLNLALQLDDHSYWLLTDDSPVTWQQITGSGVGGAVTSVAGRAGAVVVVAADLADFNTAVRTNRLDQMAVPTADVSLNSHKLTGVTDPSSSQDAATKAYVDAVASGLDVKKSVRVATTANGTLASAYENGDTIDGVALVTGDRILLKDQSTGAENGIYTVNASGAPTRATDADASSEVTGGLFVFVEEGTTNSDTGWVLTNDGTITLGSTSLTFSQFSGAGQITAGAGLTKTGNQLDVGAGTGITVNANDVAIDTSVVARKSDNLSVFAATTSAQLAGILSDETGTGAAVFANSPTLVTPALGTPSSATLTNAMGLPEAGLSTSDNTTADVSSTKHGFAPKSSADATKFLNGAATPAYALVKDSDLSTSDIATNNVSTTKHGFVPKAPNDATKYLDGTGAYSVPAGVGGGASAIDDLSDVVITSRVLGNIVQYDGSNFINAPPPEGLLTAPPTASWSWVNQGSAALTSDSYGELITMPAGSGSNNWRHRVRTITHSAAYSITAKLDVMWTRTTSGTIHAALVIRDNAGGVNKFCALGIHYDGSPEVTYIYQGDWTNNTTESVANFKQPLAKFPFNPRWFRIRIASGTRFYEASENGIDFYTLTTSSSTGFITPDQAGFAANDAAATPPLARLRGWVVA